VRIGNGSAEVAETLKDEVSRTAEGVCPVRGLIAGQGVLAGSWNPHWFVA
jgi:hypothetical protein